MLKLSLRQVIRQLVTITVTAFFMVSGFLIGLVISQILQSNQYSLLSILFVICYAAISIGLSVLCHNLGHWIAGACMGYQLISQSILQISMVPYKRPVTWLNQCWYFASGILLNFLLGVLLLLFFRRMPWELHNLYRLLILSIAAALILHSCITLTSFFSSEIPNDGKLLWGLLFGKSFSIYYITETNYLQALKAGIPPRDIPLCPFPDRSQLYAQDYLLALQWYYKALDLRKTKYVLHFAEFLAAHLQNLPSPLYRQVLCELCFLHCLKGKHVEATAYYEEVQDCIENSYDIFHLRIRSYYEAFVRQDLPAAIFYAKAGLSFQNTYDYKGLLPMETTLLQEILNPE